MNKKTNKQDYTSTTNSIRSEAAKRAAKTRKANQLKQQLSRHRIMVIARAAFFTSFATLIFIGVSQFVRATNLISAPNENGTPSNWKVVSAAHPDSMTVPITYFDQQQDCSMFEFSHCSNARDKSGGWTPNIVKDTLGTDGLPVPVNASSNNSLTSTSKNIIGHDPVQTSDNFYQWFHEVDGKSTKYERELTFTRIGNENKYTYGGRQIFPLDDVPTAQITDNHNFHFTAHMQTPIKVALSGTETFDFSGDDDVWVFLNGHLVLDIGGVHTAIDGSFTINSDGSVSSRVYEGGKTYSETTYDLELAKDQIVNLDLFYAERNTSQANTLITISDMEWLVTARASLDEEVIDNKLIQYTASIKNCDASSAIALEKIAAHVVEDDVKSGFIPLTGKTLSYSENPNSPTSWESLDVSAPTDSANGFQLSSPIILSPSGQSGDTTYVRFYVAPETNDIDLTTTVSFYLTDTAGSSGIAYDTKSSSLRNLEVVAPEYTVTYDSDDGTPISPESVAKNLTATRPADPEKTKCIFAGWYLNGESYDFDAPVTNDITLVAHWEAVPDEKYVVAFDSDGGTVVDSQIVVEHEAATIPAIPIKEGYEFLGWTIDGIDYDFTSEVTKNITLVAKWERVDFLVIFNSDGGSSVATQTIHKGNVAFEPAYPIRDGYTFIGWKLDNATYDFSNTITTDILLKAHWEKVVEPEPTPEPELTFESGRTIESMEPVIVNEPETIIVPEATIDTPSPANPTFEAAIAERLFFDQTTNDDPMVAFLPVLGAVSYVPNTGLITQLSTQKSVQTISSVVLSRPFVSITLLTFSISFAIYYPLRRKD